MKKASIANECEYVINLESRGAMSLKSALNLVEKIKYGNKIEKIWPPLERHKRRFCNEENSS